MLAFTGEHYGKKVEVHYLYTDGSGLKKIINILNSCKTEWELLPIYDTYDTVYSNIGVDVIRYKNEEKTNYCIIDEEDRVYLLVDELPQDLDIHILCHDVYKQWKFHTDPMQFPSKFKKLYEYADTTARLLVENDEISIDDQELLPYFKMRAEDESSQNDEDPDEDDWSDPVLDEAKLMLQSKVAADLLQKKGYTYEYMEYIAELDHHDISSYRYDLERLYIGYNWKNLLSKYMDDDQFEKYIIHN